MTTYRNWKTGRLSTTVVAISATPTSGSAAWATSDAMFEVGA